ncbi:PnuC-like nicotinamide mononucleotide transport [Vibrio phage D148]
MLDLLFNINSIMYTFPLAGWGTDTYSMSYLEFWVVIFNLWSVIAFRKNSLWAYPTSIIACTGWAVMAYQLNLYSDQILNLYFVGISVIGWVMWTRKSSDGTDKYKIKYMTRKQQIEAVVGLGIGVYALGTYIDPIFAAIATPVATLFGETYKHYPASLPYWDAFTTVTSFFAMYMLTKRYVESWILWTAVNVVTIGLYYYRGVYFFSAEYVIFLVNSIFALYQWHKLSKEQ